MYQCIYIIAGSTNLAYLLTYVFSVDGGSHMVYSH